MLTVVVPLAVTAPAASKSGMVGLVGQPPCRLKFSEVASPAAAPKVSVEPRLAVAGVRVKDAESRPGVDGHAAGQAGRSQQLQHAAAYGRGAAIGVRAAEGQRAAARSC